MRECICGAHRQETTVVQPKVQVSYYGSSWGRTLYSAENDMAKAFARVARSYTLSYKSLEKISREGIDVRFGLSRMVDGKWVVVK